MAMQQAQVRTSKRQRRKARRELAAFLRRLRRICGRFDAVNEYYEAVDQLYDLLQANAGAIPSAYEQRLQKAARVGDGTRAGVKFACRVLQAEIERTIQAIPITPAFVGPLLLSLIIIGVLAIGAAVTYLHITAVDVVVVNNGCGPLQFYPGAAPVVDDIIDFLGIKLPAEIPPDSQETVRLPRVTVNIDATQPDLLLLTVLGRSLPVNIPDEAEIIWDGVPQLGQRTAAKIGELPRHELVLSCH